MSEQNNQENKKKLKFNKKKSNKEGKTNSAKNRKALKNGGYSVMLSVVVIAVVVVINLIAGQIPSKYTQLDISTGKLYTIGDETKKILKNLDEDITIYHVVQSGNEDSNIEKLLQQYEELSSHIKVVKKDPVESPGFTSKYTEDSIYDNSLIVEAENRYKVVSISNIYEYEMDYSTYQQTTTGFDGEGQIASAIAYVTSEDLPVLYYIDGHNEISIPDALANRIEKANLELQSLTLLTTDEIPEDAAGILLNSPESDYSEDEAKKVIEYLKKGGRAIIITDYIAKELPNYQSILNEYGIEVTDGIVIEQDSDKYVQKPYYLVPDINEADVTSGMTGGASYVMLTGCQSFSVAEDARETLDISQILTTSDEAYVKSDPQNMTTYDKEEGDVDGPCTVGVIISEEVSSSASEDATAAEDTESTETVAEDTESTEETETVAEDTESTEETEAVAEDTESTEETEAATEDAESDTLTGTTQIACFASSAILDESANNMVSDGNYTLYMNTLNWMIDTGDDGDMVSIPSKSMETQYLTITSGSVVTWAVILCLILPITCLIVGGVIAFRRRKR